MITRMYPEYNDPVRINWREGTPEDPYIDITETLKIINNRIVLTEIPVEFNRVVINGFSEIDQRKPNVKKVPDEKDFIVNYANGVVNFHPSQEGKTVLATYKGRGFIQYPASRIWAYWKNPDVVMTLQEIIEMASIKIDEIEIAIENAIIATNNANIAAESATIAANKANQAADSAVSAANTAIDASRRADESAKFANDAALTTRLIWLEPVPTYDDIFTTYPNPEIGSTTMVEETGSRYRYEGNGIWREIDNYTRGSIPLASPTIDGLMSSEDYILTHDKLKYRRLGFTFPVFTKIGVQRLIIPFPFHGTIKQISAVCNKPCVAVSTELDIEKISDSNFGTQTTWEKLTASPISFGINDYKAFIPAIAIQNVQANDVFRINVINLDPSQEGITIYVDIEL